MTQLNYFPLFRLIIPYALGIVWAFYAPNSPSVWINGGMAIGFIALTLILYFTKWSAHYHNRYTFGASAILAAFFIANISAKVRIEANNPNHFSKFIAEQNIYVGQIISEPQQKANSIKVELEITQVKDSLWHATSGKCLVYLQPDSSNNLAYGQVLSFDVMPSGVAPTQNFDAFNYQKYLWHHYIYHQVYLPFGRYQSEGFAPINPIKKWAITQRQKLLSTYSTLGFTDTEFEIMAALTLGQKDALTPDTKQAYASAGAMHVLAVSGLHVGIVFLILTALLKPLGTKPWAKTIRTVLMLTGVWMYAIITGFSPSVIRAATMFSFMIMATNFKQHTNIYNTLAASALTVLTLYPFMLFEVGFQLSYLAVLGIVFLHKHLYAMLVFRNWLLDKAWSITCVSVAAQLATAPLGFLYFHQFPTYFLFSNLIVIPSAFVVLMGGILIQVTQFIPIVNSGIAFLLIHFVKLLNFIVFKLQELPNSIIQGIDITVIEAWLVYILIASISVWLIYKVRQALLITIACALLLSISQTIELVDKHQRKELTFYAIKKHFNVEYINGSSGVFIADSTLTSDHNQMQFSVWHHWWKRGFSNANFTMINPKSIISCVDEKQILNWDNSISDSAQIAHIEPHIIHLNTYKHWLINDRTFAKCELILLGLTCSKKAQKRANELAQKYDCTIINMRETGSVKLDFTQPKSSQLITQIAH